MSLFCPAEATQDHESFTCIEPAGHTGLHGGGVSHGRCPNCGGIEGHSDACPTPDLLEDDSQPLMEIVWGEDGIVRLEPYVSGSVPLHQILAASARDAELVAARARIAELESQLRQAEGFCSRSPLCTVRSK